MLNTVPCIITRDFLIVIVIPFVSKVLPWGKRSVAFELSYVAGFGHEATARSSGDIIAS